MIRLILMTRRRRRRRRRLALLLLLRGVLAHPPKKKGNHRLQKRLSLSLSRLSEQQRARSNECRSRVKILSGKIGKKKHPIKKVVRFPRAGIALDPLVSSSSKEILCPRESPPLPRQRNHLFSLSRKTKKKIVTRSRCSVVSRISWWICRRNRWLRTRFGIINAILLASSPSRLSSRQSSSR